MTNERRSGGPLAGIRVVELAMWHAGPTAACMLSDAGADVVKIEDRAGGDPLRGMNVVYGVSTELPGRRTALFEAYNRGKKSVTLDVRKPEGRDVLARLVERADVFVHSFRRTAVDRLGIDYSTLARQNPRLVYGWISGFGSRGPEADRASFDPVAMARSGLMAAFSGGSRNRPFLVPGGLADHMSGVMLAYAILAALHERERTGLGQEVEVSLLGGAIWLGQLNISAALATGQEIMAPDPERPANALFAPYRCADERWIFLSIPQSDRAWHTLCEALGKPELATRPEFETHEARGRNVEALAAQLRHVFRKRDSGHWCDVLRNHRDLTFERIESAPDLANDPQALANGYVVDVAQPDGGVLKSVGQPARYGRTPPPHPAAAPAHGQHTEEVLLSLGWSWDEIEALRRAEVV